MPESAKRTRADCECDDHGALSKTCELGLQPVFSECSFLLGENIVLVMGIFLVLERISHRFQLELP